MSDEKQLKGIKNIALQHKKSKSTRQLSFEFASSIKVEAKATAHRALKHPRNTAVPQQLAADFAILEVKHHIIFHSVLRTRAN